jgi:DNA-binding winged helix-turn-helix (wHTH) protein/Flp pilus assembly protein TadD
VPLYEFGPFRIDPTRKLLLRGGKPVALRPKVLDLLVFLVQREGRVVSREEIFRGLWPGTLIEDGNLTQSVHLLRGVLGDGRGEHRFVVTIPRRGYQFVGGARPIIDGSAGRGAVSSASRACLKGRYFLEKRRIEDFWRGLEYFNRAIALDPGFAPAYVGKADSYQLLSGYSAIAPRRGFPRARSAAMKALEIEETLAEAHASMACVRLYYDWNWTGAERGFERSIALDPTYAAAHHWYSDLWTALGRFDRAIERMERALQLDPLSLMIGTNIALIHYYAGDPEGAIERAREALEMDATFALAHWALGLGCEEQRRHREAIAAFRQAIRLAGRRPLFLASLGHAYALSGQGAKSRRVLAVLERLAKRCYVPAYAFAAIHAGLREEERAFRWLEQAYRERSDCLVLLKVDPRLARLRSDPRFSDLARRVGLAA